LLDFGGVQLTDAVEWHLIYRIRHSRIRHSRIRHGRIRHGRTRDGRARGGSQRDSVTI
jgi:hypothetical protein